MLPFKLQSDTTDADKSHQYIDDNSNHEENFNRLSTSNSTVSSSSPDQLLYNSYNANVSQITTTSVSNNHNRMSSVSTTSVRNSSPPKIKPKPRLSTVNYETNRKFESNFQDIRNANVHAEKSDVPKIDISSRRELFEKEAMSQIMRPPDLEKKPISLAGEAKPIVSIKERLSHLEKREDIKEATVKTLNRISGDFNSVRISVNNGHTVKSTKIDVPVVPLKERLLTLQSSISTSDDSKFEDRARKMCEPKGMQINVEHKNTREGHASNCVKEENAQIVNALGISQNGNTNSRAHKDEANLRVSSQTTNHQLIEKFSNVSITTTENTITVNEFHEENVIVKALEPIPATRKPEVLPRRQITPDLIKIEPNVDTDTLLQSKNEQLDADGDDDDDADDSVSLQQSDTVLNKHFLNLTIKSLLVDSNDICKASSLVTENFGENISIANDQQLSIDDTDQKHVVNQCNINNNNSNCKLSVEVESKSTNISDNTINLGHSQSNCTQNVAKNIHSNDSAPTITEPKTHPIYENVILTRSPPPNTLNLDLLEVKQLAKFDDDATSEILPPIESAECKNERLKCQIVGVLEKNRISSNSSIETPIKTNYLTIQSSQSPPNSPKSPKSPNKTKNIFDFIKRNLLNESTANQEITIETDHSESEKSKFYISLNEANRISQKSEENLEKSKCAIELSEINNLLDEELDKLSTDEEKFHMK